MGVSLIVRLIADPVTITHRRLDEQSSRGNFYKPAKAEPIWIRLLQAGITAEIHDGLGLAWLWFVSNRSVGVRVEVPA
jgi:hypothetical protein